MSIRTAGRGILPLKSCAAGAAAIKRAGFDVDASNVLPREVHTVVRGSHYCVKSRAMPTAFSFTSADPGTDNSVSLFAAHEPSVGLKG